MVGCAVSPDSAAANVEGAPKRASDGASVGVEAGDMNRRDGAGANTAPEMTGGRQCECS